MEIFGKFNFLTLDFVINVWWRKKHLKVKIPWLEEDEEKLKTLS